MTEKASPFLFKLSSLYKITAFRYLFKFSVTLFLFKAANDLFYYWLYGQHIKLPRYVHITTNIVRSGRSSASPQSPNSNTLPF